MADNHFFVIGFPQCPHLPITKPSHQHSFFCLHPLLTSLIVTLTTHCCRRHPLRLCRRQLSTVTICQDICHCLSAPPFIAITLPAVVHRHHLQTSPIIITVHTCGSLVPTHLIRDLDLVLHLTLQCTCPITYHLRIARKKTQ